MGLGHDVFYPGPGTNPARRVFRGRNLLRFSFPTTTATIALLALQPPRDPVTTPADSLELALHAPARVQPGASMRFTLRVRNRAQRPLDLYLRGRTPTVDVIVAPVGGDVVWRRLEDEVIPAIVHLRTVEPGAYLDLTATWDQRRRNGSTVAPGQYTARALLLAEGNSLEAPPVRFEIVER